MRIDKVGEYRMSNGQRAVVNTISSGRAYGWIMDGYWFVGPSCWQAEDGSQNHPTRADLQIVSEWVATKRHDDDLRQQQEQTIELLQKRIDTAVKVLNRISEFGDWVQWDDVVDVLEILQGNIPTNSEGSK